MSIFDLREELNKHTETTVSRTFGNYTITVKYRGNTYKSWVEKYPCLPSEPEKFWGAVFAANPDLKCKITRKTVDDGEEVTRSQTFLASKLVSPNGELLPVGEVFEAAFQARLDRKKSFQPKGKPWRLCLQLEDPPAEANAPVEEQLWFVRFLFQATDDLSLLVPVTNEMPRKILELRPFFNATKELQKIIKNTAERFPLFQRVLHENLPAGISLTLTEVMEFLKTTALQLESVDLTFACLHGVRQLENADGSPCRAM